MNRFALIVFLLFLCTGRVFANPDINCFSSRNSKAFQQTEKATITGKITDTKGNALMYASVFIANTTLGTISDEHGDYRLSHIPLGQHTLVASYVGYEFQKISINVNKSILSQNLQLKKTSLEIDAVEVQDKKSRNKWKQNFKKFKKSFIGVSENASLCKIINPEALIFHYDKETRILSAKAREPLVIENNGLGYTIHYTLEKFELHKNGLRMYIGSAQFTPFETEDHGNPEEWKKNREFAYRGSLQHFLKVLAYDSLIKSGFVVQSVTSMNPANNEKEVDYIFKLHPEPVGKDIHVQTGRYYYERRFWFNNILDVIYTKEGEGFAYGATKFPKYRLKSFQQSWIRLQGKGALFNIMGYLNDPNSLIVYGYWAFESMAEALPQDYEPD